MENKRMHDIYMLMLSKHKGQKDKGGRPYYVHLMSVGNAVEPRLKVPALLHDILEDTDTKEQELLDAGLTQREIEIIKTLTRKTGESYREYILRVADDQDAAKIKLADLSHNMDLSRIKYPTEDDFRRLRKYEKAQKLIIQKLFSNKTEISKNNER